MAYPIRLFALIVIAITCPQVFAAANEKLDYFVFLVTGKSTQGTAAEEVQKMQAAHLENFGRLAKVGDLSAAGPCADPEKIVRGIVVIKATSLADAESKFESDPYVGQGFMKTEIHQYRAVAGKLVIPAETSKMEKSFIVIVSQGEKWPAEVARQQAMRNELEEFSTKQHAAKKLGFAAIFGEQANTKSPRLAVLIFRGDDLEVVEKLIGEQAAVKDKVVRFQVFAQYLVKDAMPSE